MPTPVAIDEDLLNMLRPIGDVRVRRMFGSAGLFIDGLMFGLVIDGVLYLKTDNGNRTQYEAEGLEPFTYDKRDGKTTVMSYWRAPERLMDDPDELRTWARQAIAATRRIATAKSTPRKRAAPSRSPKRKSSARRSKKL